MIVKWNCKTVLIKYFNIFLSVVSYIVQSLIVYAIKIMLEKTAYELYVLNLFTQSIDNCRADSENLLTLNIKWL